MMRVYLSSIRIATLATALVVAPFVLSQADWGVASLPLVHKKAVVSVDRVTYFDEAAKKEVTLLVSASQDGTAVVWDLDTRSARFTLQHSTSGRPLQRVRASLDGRQIATAGSDELVCVWDTLSGRQVATLKGHTGRVLDVAWAADRRRLASCDDQGNLIVWDVPTSTMKAAYTIASDPILLSLDMTNDGSRVAVGSRGGRLYIYEVETGDRRVVGGLAGDPKCLRFAPGDRRLAVSEGKFLVVRDGRSGAKISTLERHRGAIGGLRWSDDGQRLFSAGDQGEVFEWEVDSGAVLRRAKVLQFVNDVAVFGPLGEEGLALAKPSSRVDLLLGKKEN
jgi:WD40 repeat protein